MRSVDDVQYENRLRNFDFDIIIATWPQSLSPGNEQRDLWSSQAADTHGSRNYVGIKNPAVDALIERVIFAKSRGELVAATRALDRVLLWNHYVVPQFTDDKVSRGTLGPLRPARSVARVWWRRHFQPSGGGMPKGPPNEGSWYRITIPRGRLFFEHEGSNLRTAPGPLVLTVEHFGSTAVPTWQPSRSSISR